MIVTTFAVFGGSVYAIIALLVTVMMAPFYGWWAIGAGALWPAYIVFFLVAQKASR